MSMPKVWTAEPPMGCYSRASLLPLEALKRAFSEPAPWADYQTLFFVRSAIDMAIADEEKRLKTEASARYLSPEELAEHINRLNRAAKP